MNKIFLITIVVAIAIIGYAAAWTCTDSDQARPSWNNTIHGYGPWGDNGLLGGNTSGWLNNVIETDHLQAPSVPAGCTGQWPVVQCKDFCQGTTLREFYCTDRPNHAWETIIKWHDYENSNQCNQVPEFPVFGTIIAGISVLGLVLFVSKRH